MERGSGRMGYGSVILQNGAGGYILIGLGAFILGTAVTLFCLRIRQKQRSHGERKKHGNGLESRNMEGGTK